MKRLSLGNIAVFGIALLALVASISVGISAGEPTKHIRVIYTNDTLSYHAPCG